MSEPPSFLLLIAALPQNVHLSLTGLTDVWRFSLGLALLCVSGYFTACMTVFSNLPPDGSREMMQRRVHAFAAAQLGRSLAVIGFAWLIAPMLHNALMAYLLLYGNLHALWPAVMFLTLLMLAFAFVLVQQFVRVLSEANPRGVQGFIEPTFSLWQTFTRPLTTGVVGLADATLKALGVAPEPLSRNEAMRRLLDEGLHRSSLDEHEKTLIGNVLEFGETTAHDMMVPRPDVTWLANDLSFEEAFDKVIDSGHTRFPLCDGGPDKVIGYLHAKDLTSIPHDLTEKVAWQKLARRVAFVPESARAMTLLLRFQERRSHLAVVVDEFGGMAGIITLEDLLEELVGEIRDEFDNEEPEVQRLENGETIVDGGVRLEELEDMLGISFGEVEEETIGGYIFGRLAREVKAGDELDVQGAHLLVEAVEGLRVTHVRISPVANAAAPAQEPMQLTFALAQPITRDS